MKKNDIYETEITDIGDDGLGVGHIYEGESAGFAVFVKDAVLGDVVRIKIVKAKKNYAYGRIIDIVRPSRCRVLPKCGNAARCGGCTLMQMSYEMQLVYKRNKVINCLTRIGGIRDAELIMEPVIGMETPYHYRNKMQFPVGLSADGKVLIGFYAGRTHSIIDLDSCMTGHPINNYLIRQLRDFLESGQKISGSFIYDEKAHKGLVRHILTRVGFSTGELMVCIVINGSSIGSCAVRRELICCVSKAVEEYNRDNTEQITLKSLCVNINTDRTNRILGDKCETLFGQPYITDYIGGVRFNISPVSFYQVNPIQTKVLYEKALEYAELNGTETVWDMYCGIGTISLFLAKNAAEVIGVEIVPQAICDARENARINGIENARFYCGKSEETALELYKKVCANGAEDIQEEAAGTDMRRDTRRRASMPDVVVVDPPRKGCDLSLLETIEKIGPKRVVYVSCDPATLARDVRILTEKGYELKKVAVVDQFCHTGHVETCVLLTKSSEAQIES